VGVRRRFPAELFYKNTRLPLSLAEYGAGCLCSTAVEHGNLLAVAESGNGEGVMGLVFREKQLRPGFGTKLRLEESVQMAHGFSIAVRAGAGKGPRPDKTGILSASASIIRVTMLAGQ